MSGNTSGKFVWIAALLLCLSLVFLVSACGSSEEPAVGSGSATESNNNPATETNNSEADEDPFAKTLEISWIGPGAINIQDDNWSQKQLEEKFNVKLINVKADLHNDEQMNLLRSAGEMPDAGFQYGDPKNLFDHGITRAIPHDMIRQFAPAYAALLDRNPMGWSMQLSSPGSGEFIALPGMTKNAYIIGFASHYRLDWLENIGVQPKGELIQLDDRLYFTSEPFSFDEMLDIFEKFVNNDPNGNGVKDTFALSGSNSESYAFGSLITSFQMHHSFAHESNVLEDGITIPSYLSRNYKEFLGFAANLNSKGLLDPEWTTLDLRKQWEKISSGLVGWWPNPPSYANPATQDRPPYSLLNTDPNAKILITPPERNHDGTSGLSRWSNSSIAGSFYIGADVDDEKLERILRIFDYINFDKEAKVRFDFGEEGEHFEWVGEPYASGVTAYPKSPEEGGALGLAFYKHVIYDEDMTVYLTNKEYAPIVEWLQSEEADAMRVYNHRADLFSETDFSGYLTTYGSELAAIREEFYYRVISGETDLDAEWDNYVQNMKNAGADGLIDILNQMPLLEALREGRVEY